MRRILKIALLLGVHVMAKAGINQTEVHVVMSEKMANPNDSLKGPIGYH